jgi:hypothetical protein
MSQTRSPHARASRVARVIAPLLASCAALALALGIGAGVARAGYLYVSSCSHARPPDNGQDTDFAGLVWQAASSPALLASNRCGQGGAFEISATATPRAGDHAEWVTRTPSQIVIVHVRTPARTVLINRAIGSDGYTAAFFWQGGSKQIAVGGSCCSGMAYGSGIDRSISSHTFGFRVRCRLSRCGGAGRKLVDVFGVELKAVDDTPPSLRIIGTDNLWNQLGRWIRGAWPASFQASAADGVCGMDVAVDGHAIPGPSDASPNRHSWTQCPDPQLMPLVLDTADYPNGPLSLRLSARDAATPANVSSISETLHVDNEPVTVGLSGPARALSEDGTQYVTAVATAGPSGVGTIWCALDAGGYAAHPGASAQIPVSGVGRHRISCFATNNALDAGGQPAHSPTTSFYLDIQEPSVATVSFATGRSAERVRFGHAAIVAGRLESYKGEPLGDRRVQILAAPANGSGRFSVAASVLTRPDGTWRARLPAGPSRLIEARYGGDATHAAATSRQIKLVVPASLTLRVLPRRTHWGGTIRISGRLRGRYIPPSGEFVALRIGWSSGSAEIGHVYVQRGGRFSVRYTFYPGSGTYHYRIWATSAAESDYPYAPASSRKVSITVS